jgi:MoaD family protein
LLKELSKTYGKEFEDYVYDELGNVRGHLQFLVNGNSVTALKGFKTKLREGDQIAILPPVGGG